MKTNKKNLIRIILISIILIVAIGMINNSYGVSIATAVAGFVPGSALVAVLATILQWAILLIFSALNVLIGALTGIADDGFAGAIGDVVFNRCGITSANFFPEVWIGESVKYGNLANNIVQNISKYYYVMRNLSIAILLGILLYIGIRMAISTVASEEAKYKKMLKDWAISLVLVFVLQYIMIITFFINNSLVEVLETMDPFKNSEWNIITKLITPSLIPIVGWKETIVYGSFVIATLAFVLMYVKRTIVLGFLIVISPLITITYSIDKIGDGKSQALNTWLKEFVFTVIVQPFHCIMYIVFYGSIMSSLDGDGLGNVIFAVASAFFMLKAEDIIRKIFGIQANSIGNAIGTGAMAISMATSMLKNKSDKKIDKSKGKMPKMKGNLANGGAGAANAAANATANAATNATANTAANATANATANAAANAATNATANVTANTAANTVANAAANAATSTVANSQAQSSKIQKALSKTGGYLKDYYGNYFDRNGGVGGVVRKNFGRAATAAGFIAGATVGDVKTAASTATAVGGIANAKLDSFEYKQYEKQLEENQEVFAGAYEDFARAYREIYTDADDQEIRNAAKRIYETGGNHLEEEYERDFYSKMEELADSAEIMGYSNGFDYVNDSMRLSDMGELESSSDYTQKQYNEISYESLLKNNKRIETGDANQARAYFGNDYNTVESRITSMQSDPNMKDKLKKYQKLKETMDKNYGSEKKKAAIEKKFAELENS